MNLPDEHYRLLVEAAPVMVWRASRDAKCDYFNATWLAFTGRTLEQELGDGWSEGVHPDDLTRCLEVLHGSFATRTPFEMEYRLRRHDGVYRWILDRGVPLLVDGKLGGFIGGCIDVHERREADQAKTAFLSMLSHELRTPLQSLVLCGQHIESLANAGKPVSVAVAQRLVRQTDRLRALIDRTARGTEITRGVALRLELEDVDVVALVARTLEPRRQKHAAAGSRLELRHEPPTGETRLVRADAEQLAQALEVLLDNAFGYSYEEGTITIRLAFEPAATRIEVEDEGMGIPPAELSRVGTPYFRASNVLPRQHPGLGLGLAVARDIVQAHGGTLELGAREPRGTRAAILLPPA